MEFLLNLSGPGTWPQAVDGPAGQVMVVEGRTLSLRRRPSHLPRGPDCREVGVCIRASAVSHAASCSRDTGSQGEAIPGTDPGRTRKPVLGVSPGPALREKQQKPPAERLEPASSEAAAYPRLAAAAAAGGTPPWVSPRGSWTLDSPSRFHTFGLVTKSLRRFFPHHPGLQCLKVGSRCEAWILPASAKG